MDKKEIIENILSLDPQLGRRLDIVTIDGIKHCTHCYKPTKGIKIFKTKYCTKCFKNINYQKRDNIIRIPMFRTKKEYLIYEIKYKINKFIKKI